MSGDEIALGVVGGLGVLNYFGFLPRRRTASDAAAELGIETTRANRLQGELTEAKAHAAQLAQERTNEPVIKLVAEVLSSQKTTLETQQRTLDKLASFNGSLQRTNDGLDAATEALKLVAGVVGMLTPAQITVNTDPEGGT